MDLIIFDTFTDIHLDTFENTMRGNNVKFE